MEYFNLFPKVKETINGSTKTLVNILFSPDIFPEESEQVITENEIGNEIGDLSLSIYEDANNFWAILYANELINPWEVMLEDQSEFIANNESYSGFFAKYTLSPKLDPRCFVEFKSGDIIVPVVDGLGRTAAQDVFPDYNTLNGSSTSFPAWIVDNFFEDTKKAKITQTLNVGGTASIYNVPENGGAFFILRKGDTGYFPIPNEYNPTQRTVTGLTSYRYTKSPVAFQKISEPKNILSANTIITRQGSNLDTLLTVASDNSPLSAGLSAYTEYNVTTTDIAFVQEQGNKSKLTYIKPNYLRSILQSVK
jgi:hypothetical protein